ncbi:hypothetical protein QAD02_003788 [Eretmocerus hayati]|uniref:Uncharacterized protein n=1 Tax=Eretmocerus hayati TaxID=131215 RepID=A0ACC2NQE0_9HYME|nr:hypothetical protein QAD02_003788 [Eretmocerus hayati]
MLLPAWKNLLYWYLSCSVTSIVATSLQNGSKHLLIESSLDINEDSIIILPENNIRIESHSIFASCKENHTIPTSCEVHLGQLNPIGEYSLKKTCNVDIAWNEKRLRISSLPMALYSFSNLTKALITWDEISSQHLYFFKNIAVVDMASCNIRNWTFVAPIKLPNRSRRDNIIVIVKRDTFDIIVSDPHKCEGYDKCKLIYTGLSDQPERIEEFSTDDLPAFAEYAPSTLSSPEIIYFKDPNHFAMSISNRVKQLETNFGNRSAHNLASSVAHEFYTICGMFEGGNQGLSLNCDTFYRNETKPKTNNQFDVTKLGHNIKLKDVKNVDILNSADGNVYVLLYIVSAQNTNSERVRLHLMRFDKNKDKDPLHLREFHVLHLKCSVQRFKIREGQDEICFSFMCADKVQNGSEKAKNLIKFWNDCSSKGI